MCVRRSVCDCELAREAGVARGTVLSMGPRPLPPSKTASLTFQVTA